MALSELLTDQSKLTNKQKEALEQFKERLGGVIKPHHDDRFLLRWLIARDFDLNKSETMLRDHLIWRERVKADEIFDWEPPEILNKYYAGGLSGYDKEGRPISIEPFALPDFKGILHSVKKSDIIKFKILYMEIIHREFQRQTDKLGRPVHGLVIIADLDQYGIRNLWKPALDLSEELLKMIEANYPETMYRVYAINGPRIFQLLYRMAKPFMSEATKNKVHVLGANWKSKLLEDIEADQLPVHWGGTQTEDDDPMCKNMLRIGGQIPKDIYIDNKSTLKDESTLLNVTVSRNSKHEVKCVANKPGMTLRWRFFTENHDIGFCVKHQLENGTTAIVITKQRINSHMVAEDGAYICQETGTYVVEFDNTHSYLTSKSLWYTVTISDKEGDEIAASENAT